MTRSGYVDDCEHIALYRRAVGNALAGKRGRAFLMEMRDALDAMPVKELSGTDFYDLGTRRVCALGAVAIGRGADPETLAIDGLECDAGTYFGIAECMAREVMNENDTCGEWVGVDTPADRWRYMRRWVDQVLEDPRMDEV